MDNHQHSFIQIYKSRQPFMIVLKGIILLIVGLQALYNIYSIYQSLSPPYIYVKDIISEFLIAKAVLSGVSPYLPLPELAAMFIGPLPVAILPHPTPHPPTLILLFFPFGLINFEQAALLWFFCEIILLLLVIYLLYKEFGVAVSINKLITVAFLSLAWGHLMIELYFGQLMTLLLFCLIMAWKTLRKGNDFLGGFFLGMMLAIKLMAWPIVIYLLLARRLKPVITAVSVFLGVNIITGIIIGFDQLANYYFVVLPTVEPYYHGHEDNISLWTIGWRVFEGTGSSEFSIIQAPPLIESPIAARLVSFIIPLILLLVGLVLAERTRNIDVSFSVMIGISLLVNPIAWGHYTILLIIPVVLIGRHLLNNGFPNFETNLSLIALVFFFFQKN